MAKRDIEENDTLVIRVKVLRVWEDGRITVSLPKAPVTTLPPFFDIVRVEKG